MSGSQIDPASEEVRLPDSTGEGQTIDGELIYTSPHEFSAQFNFNNGLTAYFALDSVVKLGDGSQKGQFEFHDEDTYSEADESHEFRLDDDTGTYTVTLYYQDSNIIHPGEQTPAGTRFDIDEIREFRLAVEAVEGSDKSGQKGFNAHIRPRWQHMRVENSYGEESVMRHPLDEGLNVKIDGSNIEFHNYHRLLKKALESVDINSRYFESAHDSSSVTQAERYVRIYEDVSGPIHARDGPLARLAHLLEDDRSGRRKIEQADTAEDGTKVPGYRHQVGLDERRVREVFEDHSLPKQWKHYRARQSHNLDEDNPLKHPKVGAIYKRSLWRDRDNTHGVTPDELHQLATELDEALLSIVSDADIDVTSTAPYVADDYFDATLRERERQVVDLPLQEIEARQESVVVKHLKDGLSPIQEDTYEKLVTDGGKVSPQDIADEYDYHPDSVYRALEKIDDTLERKRDEVSLRSPYVAEMLHDALRSAKDHTEKALTAAGEVLEAADRGLDDRTCALVAWAEQYTDHFARDGSGDGEGVEIDIGTVEGDDRRDALRQVREIIREGYELWRENNKDEIDYRMGTWKAHLSYTEQKNADLKSLETEEIQQTEFVSRRVWKSMSDVIR